MYQILESTYMSNVNEWNRIARNQGGLEICDSSTGEVIYTISGF